MYTVDISTDEVINALATFLTPFVPGADIVRGLGNLVSMPSGDAVYLTEISTVDLATPAETIDTTTTSIKQSKQITIQIDFYSDAAQKWATAVKNTFVTHYSFFVFPANIRPLFTGDARLNPFVSAERQYVPRWTLDVTLQYNPVVTTPGQSANTLAINHTAGV